VERDFDIVVVGGGHAGTEAACTAAILGNRTCLITLARDTIAQMSCNPAIGGVGKGQIVREIDALGGLMGLAADATGMQFRMLNRSKGPAVWGPRCQSDRHAYARWVRTALENQADLTIIEGDAAEIITEGRTVIAVRLNSPSVGSEISCRAAIITTGTFLNGVMHLGEKMWAGGRYDEPPAAHLSDSLRRCGLKLERLKTGTCPRIAAESIDYGKCIRQDGDDPPTAFSFMNDWLEVEQVPCWQTATTPPVHDAVRANLHRAPLYTGQIKSTGPRYCPSFETKVVRFADKPSHVVFLEPEARDTNWVYANGIATSLPTDVQEVMVRNIPGLAGAEILRWGYAIEYDFAPPTQVVGTLETKTIRGLYLAGQILGTTGYEEAAALGLMAGINASRAEHRLSLRSDNADRRLTPIGREIALVDDLRWAKYSANRTAVTEADSILHSTNVDGKSLWAFLQSPHGTLEDLLALTPDPPASRLCHLLLAHPASIDSLAVDARYEGYIRKESTALQHMQQLDSKLIPSALNYAAVPQLRHEARERLSEVRPRSLGQALRVPGITPADITVLAIHLAARDR